MITTCSIARFGFLPPRPAFFGPFAAVFLAATIWLLFGRGRIPRTRPVRCCSAPAMNAEIYSWSPDKSLKRLAIENPGSNLAEMRRFGRKHGLGRPAAGRPRLCTLMERHLAWARG